MHCTVFGSCLLPITPQRLQKPKQHIAVCKSPSLFVARRLATLRPEQSGWCQCQRGFPAPKPVWLSTIPSQASTAPTQSRTVCSAADSTAAASPSGDDSRKASNAAASTSDSQPATSPENPKPPASPYQQLFLSLESGLMKVLAKMMSFFKSIPAFIQREKLQRLHKRALDNPTDADRSVGTIKCCTSSIAKCRVHWHVFCFIS